MRGQSLAERVVAKIDWVDPSACWRWTSNKLWNGYGTIYVSGQGPKLAHRVIYEMVIGPIPEGMTLDHLCRVRDCVRPDHLEPVPMRENIRRGTNPCARNMAKTHCIHGHALSGINVFPSDVGKRYRRCRQCHNDRRRRARNPMPRVVRRSRA